jgi:molybdopterin converting factor small subunit
MAKMEQLELDAHRGQLVADVKALVERYRSIFEWDVPGIDQVRSDRLILQAIRDALDGVEKALADEDAA